MLCIVLFCFYSFISLAQGLVNFFYKGPSTNVPGFARRVISVTITQFCYCCMEAAIDTHTGLSVAFVSIKFSYKNRQGGIWLQVIVYTDLEVSKSNTTLKSTLTIRYLSNLLWKYSLACILIVIEILNN